MTQAESNESHIVRNIMIPLSDGVSLAADLYAPPGDGPFPTLVNYYPYHKDGIIGCMHEYPRHYFAQHGYANLLVDMRGLGSSEGVAWESLDAREGKDGAEIIDWASKQSWCDGNIGMWGFSYGGTSTMQTAVQQHPALKAIAPVMTLSDIYRELVSRLDCLPWFGNWGALMVSMNNLPPLLQDPEGRWMETWMERLETGFPHIFAAKEHRSYDEYWQSRVIPLDKINVPTYIIGGWRDVNVHAMVQVYEAINAPKKMIQGPWTHLLPYHAPNEQWDYLHGLKRWWDRWLKGEKNGIDEEPPVTMFVMGTDNWREERQWPIERTEFETLHVCEDGVLSDQAQAAESSDPYVADPTVGTTSGLWDGTGLGIGTPIDQGPDDARSLTYTTEPLNEDLEITGSAEAVMHVALDKGDDLILAAKLCSVGPDGSSSLITVGSIKGSTYESDEHPKPLAEGDTYEFKIDLFNICYLIPRGHRLRLSVSCADFPRLWPTRTNPHIRLLSGGNKNSTIRIPVVPADPDPLPVPEIRRPDPNISDGPLGIDFVPRWTIEDDQITGRKTVRMGSVQSTFLPAGGKLSMDVDVRVSVAPDRPDGARIEGGSDFQVELPAGDVVDVSSSTLLYRDQMFLEGKVSMNGEEIYSKKWRK